MGKERAVNYLDAHEDDDISSEASHSVSYRGDVSEVYNGLTIHSLKES